MTMSKSRIGVIGGTGLYQISALNVHEAVSVETPFGDPSDELVLGDIGGHEVVFLPRHGRGHRLLPGEINYRANILALKKLDVTHLVSVSAVGSMRERYQPTDVVLPDQFFDRTRQRPSTFFGNGLVAHVSFADPVCPHLAAAAAQALERVGATCHRGGTYICIEGPQFSTRAESNIYRQLGADVIGMTNMQEAKLAREAEMCYTCMAFVTDYDCWKEDEEAVSGESVMAVLGRNVETAKQALAVLIEDFQGASSWTCGCREALRAALITDFTNVPAPTLEALAPLIGRYRRESS
jgi:5'-methylthioadenosine phosphorylase